MHQLIQLVTIVPRINSRRLYTNSSLRSPAPRYSRRSTKPDQPPVPLIATVVKASSETASDPNQRMMLVFTDPSGELNEDSTYPLNIWEAV